MATIPPGRLHDVTKGEYQLSEETTVTDIANILREDKGAFGIAVAAITPSTKTPFPATNGCHEPLRADAETSSGSLFAYASGDLMS